MTNALTIRNPYAARIVAGVKTIENRTRSTQVRGQILIHAGGQVHDGILTRENPTRRPWQPSVDRLPRMAVIGAANIASVHNALNCGDECIAYGGIRAEDGERNGMPAVHHWVLSNPIEFVTPIPRVRGQLGIWTPDDRVQHLASLAIAQVTGRG
jgi:hypothetical protein